MLIITLILKHSRNEFLYSDILTLIEDGSLSCLWSPPRSALGANQPEHKSWSEWQMNLSMADSTEIVTACTQIFQSSHSNLETDQLHGSIVSSVVKDLSDLQVQPAIMDTYRRYVIIKDEEEKHLDSEPGRGSVSSILDPIPPPLTLIVCRLSGTQCKLSTSRSSLGSTHSSSITICACGE
jgi:hypothetical protein